MHLSHTAHICATPARSGTRVRTKMTSLHGQTWLKAVVPADPPICPLKFTVSAPSEAPSALHGVNQRGQGCPESKLWRKPLRQGGCSVKRWKERKGGGAYLSRQASISSSKWINSAFWSGVLLWNGRFCLKMGCVIFPHLNWYPSLCKIFSPLPVLSFCSQALPQRGSFWSLETAEHHRYWTLSCVFHKNKFVYQILYVILASCNEGTLTLKKHFCKVSMRKQLNKKLKKTKSRNCFFFNQKKYKKNRKCIGNQKSFM